MKTTNNKLVGNRKITSELRFRTFLRPRSVPAVRYFTFSMNLQKNYLFCEEKYYFKNIVAVYSQYM